MTAYFHSTYLIIRICKMSNILVHIISLAILYTSDFSFNFCLEMPSFKTDLVARFEILPFMNHHTTHNTVSKFTIKLKKIYLKSSNRQYFLFFLIYII